MLVEDPSFRRLARGLGSSQVPDGHKGLSVSGPNEAIALRVGKSFITECWWKILPSVASLAVWGVHRFRMATRV